MKKTITIALAASLALLIGCSKQTKEAEVLAVEVPPVVVTQEIKGTAVPIPEARTKFKAGDEVILTGLIMGVPHPFVEGRAVFVLGDEATITPCDAMSEDHCSTPWDACCDPAQVRMDGTATIQVLGEDGKPARTGLKDVKGLAELNRVTVSGTVADNSTAEAFIVNANAIHIGVR